MHTSFLGKAMIMSLIGYNLTAFKASQYDKDWTIGFGHSGPDVHEGDTITKERAKELFEQDIIPYEDAVNALKPHLPFTMNENQFDALVRFSFGMEKDYLNEFKGKNESFIAIKILNSRFDSDGNVIPELERRRVKECVLFLSEPVAAKNKNENSTGNKEKDPDYLEGILNLFLFLLGVKLAGGPSISAMIKALVGMLGIPWIF